ncbi:MAG TPA: HAMP domain-containing sensor histidine kinase, partial [Polyangiaceae bacterium]
MLHVAFEMVNHVSALDLAAASNLMIGGCCLAVTFALAYALRTFRSLRHRAAYVPLAIFLTFSGVAHLVDAFGLFHIDLRVHGFLLALTAVSGIGTVALLRELLLRAAALAKKEEVGQRRETELAATVEQLSSAYSRSLELAEQKTQVFANVSHELRTPLTLILGPVQKLREAPNLLEEQRTVITMIERNAHLLLGHVSDLLELSRVDSVGVELNRRSTDIGLLIRTLASSFRDLAKHLGVEYEVDLPRMGKSVLLDSEKLERIAMNLLANAFKFTPRGGRVVFRVRLASDSERPQQLELVLSVDDSGPGIPVEDRARVFERFRQLDGKPNR